jgi:hypothetical protein
MTSRTTSATTEACDRTAPDRPARDRAPTAPWRPLTRRAFVAALAAAAAALAIEDRRGRLRALGDGDDVARAGQHDGWICRLTDHGHRARGAIGVRCA